MRNREEFIRRVQTWAAAQPDLCAAILVGSAARSVTPADQWSDIDIALFVKDPATYLGDSAWLADLGDPMLTFVEPTATGGSYERRVLFVDGIEADFACFPVEATERLGTDLNAGATLRRGYRVLVDRVGIESLLKTDDPQTPIDDAATLEELANDFWYHALWAAKKLRRGERWVARSCVDCYLHARLIEATARHATAFEAAIDTWHDGRFLERWAPADIVAALWDSLVHAPDDIADAITRSVNLFDKLTYETAQQLNLSLEAPRDETRAMLATLLAPLLKTNEAEVVRRHSGRLAQATPGNTRTFIEVCSGRAPQRASKLGAVHSGAQ